MLKRLILSYYTDQLIISFNLLLLQENSAPGIAIGSAILAGVDFQVFNSGYFCFNILH